MSTEKKTMEEICYEGLREEGYDERTARRWAPIFVTQPKLKEWKKYFVEMYKIERNAKEGIITISMNIVPNEAPPRMVYLTKDYIVLNLWYEYEIELDRCNTIPKILERVFHLSGKVWGTRPVLFRFISLVTQHHNLNIHKSNA